MFKNGMQFVRESVAESAANEDRKPESMTAKLETDFQSFVRGLDEQQKRRMKPCQTKN